MLINAATALIGSRVILVPYRKCHVPLYHEWMSDPVIREATASEELTLEEEYGMQSSWRTDEDKLTFIALYREPLSPLPDTNDLEALHRWINSHNPDRMIGDVNLFLSLQDEETNVNHERCNGYDQDSNTVPSTVRKQKAEVEVMIASVATRRLGLATSTLQIFLSYASKNLFLPPCNFFARVGTKNEASIKMFEKLGFTKGKVTEVFEEVEMVWPSPSDTTWPWLPEYIQVEYADQSEP